MQRIPLLNCPDDPAISSEEAIFCCLAENPSKLADEIPFLRKLDYAAVKNVPLGSEILKSFIDLNEIYVDEPFQNIQRFLDLLKYTHIAWLVICGDQPQELFDQLQERCNVQGLFIKVAPSDLGFLFGLKHLNRLVIDSSFDAAFIRKVFEKLKFRIQVDKSEPNGDHSNN